MAGERFFDAESPGSTAPARILLERREEGGIETFQLLRRFGYRDARLDEPFIVPADIESFRSDLTSVPVLFTWLVPRTGNHLPAALLHDGLISTPGEPASYLGPAVTREQADRIFRDAMSDLGTGRVRRWLIWTAVALATALTSAEKGGMLPRWRWFGVVAGTLAAVVALGVLATIDLFDGCSVLPWMGGRSWWSELLGGAAFAIVIPALLATLWGRLWRAGLIACVALALLLHVTVLLAALSTVYQLIESPRQALAGARRALTPPVFVAVLALVAVVMVVLWRRCP